VDFASAEGRGGGDDALFADTRIYPSRDRDDDARGNRAGLFGGNDQDNDNNDNNNENDDNDDNSDLAGDFDGGDTDTA